MPCDLAWGNNNGLMRVSWADLFERFNSYTQQLCINDAVKKSNNESASESDLRVKADPAVTGKNTSQIVTWTAKFVDRISEITDSMNIAGMMRNLSSDLPF
jgi:hypothetical protein